ncbi:MAG TPA: response regulator [Candidatus Binatia bacterium]|nr:response regulator [Candidatus Binatia bacterium]
MAADRVPASTGSVLVVQEEPRTRATLVAALTAAGFTVEAPPTAEDALVRLRRGGIDLVLTDLGAPGGGLALLQAIRRAGMGVPAVVIAAHGSLDDAVAAMKFGAFDVVTEPLSSADLLNVARWAVAVRDRAAARPGRSRSGTLDVCDRAVPQLAAGLAGFTVHEVERALILETLARTANNRTRAARMLGISPRTLRNKLAGYRAHGVAPGVVTDGGPAGWLGE